MHEQLARWWNGISLRTKITALTVALLTFGLFVAGTGTMSLLSGYLLEEVDARVDSAIDDVERSGPTVGGGDDTCEASSVIREYFVAIVDEAGAVLCRSGGPEGAPAMSELDAEQQADDTPVTVPGERGVNEWRVETRRVDLVGGEPAVLVVGLNLLSTNSVVARFAAIFMFFAVAVVVVGGVATRLLVTSTFAPLRDVEATAARFADGDFTQRLSGSLPNTEVGRLTRSLNAMLARIDRAFADRARTIEQMRRFISDASHELRTPLVSLRGYAELYRIGAIATDEDIASAMDRIEREAVRMSELVRDLLELARLDETRPISIQPVHLDVVAHDTAMDARAQEPDRTISVVSLDFDSGSMVPTSTSPIEVITAVTAAAGDARGRGRGGRRRPPARGTFATQQLARIRSLRARRGETPPTDEERREDLDSEMRIAPVVAGEENKIRQVVTNLMGNALRYSPPGSPIEVGFGADVARRIGVVAIIDHGDGIPEQLREKIFQRFWRADSSRTRETGGSGLGLSIVSAIVASHGGTVQVDETPGGGATFRVVLPLLPIEHLSTGDDW